MSRNDMPVRPDAPSRLSIFFRGALSGVGAQAVSVLVSIVSIPIGLSYLGPAYFGVWMTINSVIAYLALSQFGVGTATAAMITNSGSWGDISCIVRRQTGTGERENGQIVRCSVAWGG